MRSEANVFFYINLFSSTLLRSCTGCFPAMARILNSYIFAHPVTNRFFLDFMPYKEKEPERIFFTIGEVAKKFKVNTSLIRFWEKEFDILKPKKNNKGNRLFTKQDLDNLHVIYHLVKERGFKLDGAKKKLKQSRDEVVNSVEMVKSLKAIKSFLMEMKESL
jgi:DNA-binding transcriptional MerR regulator